ncbi:hypothetical protein RHGRI_020459 [Rhododendron griersonianum]|uniref:Uncharacterized protein n=1 Tax=Rhododendron griersonianum TaxID=479676 RepID=A0AAV6JJS4_9ERIC|nr:hypothetical protein RHGRI_020459 [Rhododendron griersonianum]
MIFWIFITVSGNLRWPIYGFLLFSASALAHMKMLSFMEVNLQHNAGALPSSNSVLVQSCPYGHGLDQEVIWDIMTGNGYQHLVYKPAPAATLYHVRLERNASIFRNL